MNYPRHTKNPLNAGSRVHVLLDHGLAQGVNRELRRLEGQGLPVSHSAVLAMLARRGLESMRDGGGDDAA
jgi:hypothetical protein